MEVLAVVFYYRKDGQCGTLEVETKCFSWTDIYLPCDHELNRWSFAAGSLCK